MWTFNRDERVDMDEAVQPLHVRPAQVDQVAVEDVAVSLVEVDPGPHPSPRLLALVESVAAVAGGHPRGEVLGRGQLLSATTCSPHLRQAKLELLAVVRQGLELRLRPAPVVGDLGTLQSLGTGAAVTRGRNIQPWEGGRARVPSCTVCRDTERSTHRGSENCSSS